MNNSTERQYPGLELLRTIAAALVVLWHYKIFYSVSGKFEAAFYTERPPFYEYMYLFYDHGYFGVQIFWSLSGFIFFWRYHHKIFTNEVSFKKFSVLRFSRLYPLHLVTLLFLLGIQFYFERLLGHPYMTHTHSNADVLAHFMMASGWGFTDWETLNLPVWSVSVEILVYFMFFYLTRFLGVNIWVTLLITAFLFLATLLSASRIVDCAFLFYTGGMIYQLQRVFPKFWFNPASALISLSIGYVIYLIMGRWNFLTLALLCSSLLFACIWLRLPKRLEATYLQSGLLTYSIYMIQFPIQALIFLICLKLGIQINPDSLLFFFSYLMILYWASEKTYTYFEVPAQAWIRSKMK